jgi:hypothetical protein
MLTRRNSILLASIFAVVFCASSSHGASPWKRLIPFAKVSADPNRDYWLTENDGPWNILATSFAGPGAEEQARALVLELRKEYKLPAFMHKRHYDYTEPVIGNGLNRYGGPRRMKYAKSAEFDEIAVLVGNYEAFDAPGVEDDLEMVKSAKPACLDISGNRGQKTTQRFVGLREIQRLLHADPSVRELGPMRRAFVVRNPLIPKEYFVSQGLDKFVIDMNRPVKYTLLKNPGRYTVRVASFRGETYFKGEEERRESSDSNSFLGLPMGNEPTKLELAAETAHRLTIALRERGIEAYEFHDRCESIVTVGSFNATGTPRADGRIEINPSIHKIIQTYGPRRDSLPGQPVQALRPSTLEGISFDMQPMIIQVPKTSIGSDYVLDN